MTQEIAQTKERPALFSAPSPSEVEESSTKLLAEFPEFRLLVEKYGFGADTFRRFGLMRWKLGDLGRAMQLFTTALTWEPANAWIWEDLGGVYLASNNTKMAFYCVNYSIEIDDARAQSWLMLATVLDKAERHDEAVSAYSRAIMLDETLSSAHFGLGIIHLRNGRLPLALQCLRETVTHDPLNAFAHVCLGHAFYSTGDFASAARSLDFAMTLSPLDPASALARVKSMTFQAIIEGRVNEAFASYGGLIGADDQENCDISQEAFTLLNVYGYRNAAHAVGLYRLARSPGNMVQRYMNSAVAGEQLLTAPVEYIEQYFDDLAPDFDRKLVDSLQYRAPSVMAELLSKHRESFNHILDLGCGTGLAAEPLAKFGAEVIGIDLSSVMLDKAKSRCFYSELMRVEAIAFMATKLALFDLIFAADVLVYVGDLRAFFNAASTALVKDGILAVSIETIAVGDFELQPSGRFAHSIAYVEKLASEDFTKLESSTATLRLEMRHPIAGEFILFEKKV